VSEAQPQFGREAPSDDAARYRELFESIPYGVLVTGITGTIEEANRAAGELLGVPPARLVGKPIPIFVPPEHRSQFRKTILTLSRLQSAADWEFELQGRTKRFSAHLTAVPMAEGGLRWTIQDVSERNDTEHRLRTLAAALEERVLERTDELEHERARLSAIVDQLPGGLIIAEAPAGKVLIVNEDARRMLGVQDGDSLRGIGGTAFRPDGSRLTPEETPLARALTGEVVNEERLEMIGPDGELFVVDVSAVPVHDRAQRTTAAVSMIIDVTERVERDRAERDFVTNAAHELQSPLSAITSAVEVLQSGAKEAEERDLFIEHIERESDRLNRLTRALLTLARAQVDVEAPRLELIDVCPLLETIAERMAPAEGVELSVECPQDLALITNRELLEQTVSNVVRNAVKYTSEGSIRVIANARPRGGGVMIAVRDTGIGIDSEALPHIPERFYRAESGYEGFGLGLAIVEASMKVLGGDLEIGSSPGYGTTVTMTFPVKATRMNQ
jgi:two-component system, sensor histidine kinase